MLLNPLKKSLRTITAKPLNQYIKRNLFTSSIFANKPIIKNFRNNIFTQSQSQLRSLSILPSLCSSHSSQSLTSLGEQTTRSLSISKETKKDNIVVPSVKLVSCSHPSGDFANKGIDNVEELIAFCAKVSNPSNQINTATSRKLIKYLIKHQHWSPLEMVSACLEINTTRDIARQILRHRSFSFQEFSQRYANTDEFGEQFVIREARLQDPKNRQNSIETTDIELSNWWNEQQASIIHNTGKVYEEAIQKGIAKEQARVILPEGNTKSRLYMNGTIRSWIHYIELRAANGTQKEHMEIARICAKVISDIFPFADDILKNI